MIVLGFSGTRAGLTYEQETRLGWELRRARADGADRLVHGVCVGADEVAARLARRLGLRVVGFPSAELGHPERSTVECDVLFSVRPPLKRNRLIARSCDRLIACPRQTREFLLARAAARGVPPERVVGRGSGTWATVRYVLAERKPVLVVFPDGSTASPLEDGWEVVG